jgi:hypothetical protein
MPSSLLAPLQDKIHLAAAQLVALKKERDTLAAELALIREENRRARKILREHAELCSERDKIKAKLEVLSKKLHQLKV